MSTATRLNAEIRKAILNKVIRETVWAKLKVALEERAVIAEEVRQLSFGGKLAEVEKTADEIETLKEKINELSGSRTHFSNGEITGSHINVNVDGMHIELPFTDQHTPCLLELKDRHIKYFTSSSVYKISQATCYRDRIVIKDEALKKRIMDNVELISRLESESGAIIPTISAMLSKVKTVQKLIEMWPEAEAYIPESVDAVSSEVSGLPISIADLNSKIAALAA